MRRVRPKHSVNGLHLAAAAIESTAASSATQFACSPTARCIGRWVGDYRRETLGAVRTPIDLIELTFYVSKQQIKYS